MMAAPADPIPHGPTAITSAGIRRRRMRRAYGSARFPSNVWCGLRCGLAERRDELLEVLDLQQSALMLVVGPPCVGSPALGRLAVTQVQDVLFRGGTMSSESKHDDPPRSAARPPRLDLPLSVRNIGYRGPAGHPPIR